MRKDDFQWGPLARGFYAALLWLTLLVGIFLPQTLLYWIPLLLFLGFGLRPFLVATGLYRFFGYLATGIDEMRWRKVTDERRREIERKQRDDKYRDKRYRDPRLPKNW